jgi:hypothetical protein
MAIVVVAGAIAVTAIVVLVVVVSVCHFLTSSSQALHHPGKLDGVDVLRAVA